MRRFLGFTITVLLSAVTAASADPAPRVLLVGTYHGIAGQYRTLQAAIDAARPHDVILVAPGDYKTTASHSPRGEHGMFPAGILVSTPYLTIRGMSRNGVVIDGTTKGSRCNHSPADQNYGPKAKGGPAGLNGVEVWKAGYVTIQNMTACNFLGGSGGDGATGNEFWWNGGAGSGKVGGYGFTGSYLTATSTFFNAKLGPKKAEVPAAQYGIFSSNWSIGTWDHTYASNMNDSGYYIGACQQVCDQVINHAWAEFNALGYSGSNSGGVLVVENSKFDNNQDGFDTNSQNGDNPPPQNGACPNNGVSPITHTHSCWVFMNNLVTDNNNPNVPTAGAAALGPTGTGMSISGGRNDTVMNNTFSNNNAWGVVIVPFPDKGRPCTGGEPNNPLLGNGSCLYDPYGNNLIDNRFINDGGFGHPTNGAFDEVNFLAGNPADCYFGNTGNGGGPLNPEAAALQAQYASCPTTATQPSTIFTNLPFLQEVLCDTGVMVSGVGCPAGVTYPKATAIRNGLHPLPAKLPSMPNPCAGVPANPWCKKG